MAGPSLLFSSLLFCNNIWAGRNAKRADFLPGSGVSTGWVCYLDGATLSRYLMYVGVEKVLEEGQ